MAHKHTITFERIAKDYDFNEVRSITVDHERGLLFVITDSDFKLKTHSEGATVPPGRVFTTGGDH